MVIEMIGGNNLSVWKGQPEESPKKASQISPLSLNIVFVKFGVLRIYSQLRLIRIRIIRIFV